MGIPNKQAARYNSLQEFISLSKGKDNAPASTNLFSVRIASPFILRPGSGAVASDKLQIETNELDWQLDYYCENINLPSKQMTTGQVVNVGSGFKYATNTAYSQLQATFKVPRSQYSRSLFERWTSLISPDSEQHTRYYNEYVCPKIMIYKWERGGGDPVVTDPKMIKALRRSGQINNLLLARKYQLTAAWEVQNAFPYNIGSIQLNNQQTKIMTMTIGFYYERYRFYPRNRFDDPGVLTKITAPANMDNYFDASFSDLNREIFENAARLTF
tara:strand:+ start:628 stop:1443 length:816 start_codon:yes stop_codon:yes gene_type:complete